MRTRAVLGSIFASTAVLIVGWQAGGAMLASNAVVKASAPAAAGAASAPAIAPTAAATAAPAATPTAAAAAPAGPKDGTYTGGSVGTQFGSVQVSVTIAAGKITDVTPLQLTNRGGQSVEISNYAAPLLHDEVLASQSANVSMIGGATYTSEAYLSSLQSALNQAKF